MQVKSHPLFLFRSFTYWHHGAWGGTLIYHQPLAFLPPYHQGFYIFKIPATMSHKLGVAPTWAKETHAGATPNLWDGLLRDKWVKLFYSLAESNQLRNFCIMDQAVNMLPLGVSSTQTGRATSLMKSSPSVGNSNRQYDHQSCAKVTSKSRLDFVCVWLWLGCNRDWTLKIFMICQIEIISNQKFSLFLYFCYLKPSALVYMLLRKWMQIIEVSFHIFPLCKHLES